MRRILHAYEQLPAPYIDIVTLLKWRGDEIVLESFEGDLEEQPPAVAVELGGFDVMRSVVVEVGELAPFGAHTTRLPFSWHAAEHANWFPKVDAALEVTGLSSHPPLTEFALFGTYRIPFGVLGNVADGLIGHRLTEEIGKRLLARIRDHIADELVAMPSLID